MKRKKFHSWLVLKALPFVLLAMPFVILSRMLRPLVLIRFGQMGGTGRIGNFAPEAEFYLSEFYEKPRHRRVIDLHFYQNQASNEQLKKMANRKLHIFPFTRWLDTANRKLPGGQAHVIGVNSTNRRLPKELHMILNRTPIQLSFTHYEELAGQKALMGMGIHDSAPYICFHSRDSAYLANLHPENDWSYHNYRDYPIDNYMSALNELISRNYLAVRMGAVVNQPLDNSDPRIIDYATSFRTDFLDIYLIANCRFFLGGGSGIDAVATVFRKPIALVNYIPMGNPRIFGPRDIFIPKKLWLTRESRYMTFEEIAASEVGSFGRTEYYHRAGIEVVDNTAEEIFDLVMELEDRITGVWEVTPEDIELQRVFWSYYRFSTSDGPFTTRIGTKFLRSYRDLLT